ncbi:unnamed protein product, partial [Polarella glacialis]
AVHFEECELSELAEQRLLSALEQCDVRSVVSVDGGTTRRSADPDDTDWQEQLEEAIKGLAVAPALHPESFSRSPSESSHGSLPAAGGLNRGDDAATAPAPTPTPSPTTTTPAPAPTTTTTATTTATSTTTTTPPSPPSPGVLGTERELRVALAERDAQIQELERRLASSVPWQSSSTG